MGYRTEKYNSNFSRSEKNKELYNDLYKDTNYSNMVVIDDSNEIDINKIKQIIDKEKRPTRETNNNDFYSSLKDYYQISDKEEPKKTYDINEVLRDAKNKRDIIEEANEKRKIENYKFKSNLDLENELAKTRKVYNDLVKEETELLNIMNTLTNIDVKSNQNLSNTTSIALDLLDDFKEEPNKIKKEDTKSIEIRQVDDDSTEYSTDTFMFNTKDFDSLKNIKEQIKKSNGFIKVLIFIFTVIIIVGCYFVITKFILK